MSHIFISYSRQDQDYVTLLAQALESHRLPVWLDDRINYGSEWPREIQRHLDACLAFVLVMSPRSRESTWVNNELARAIRLKKPIFPLWLEGDLWFEVEAYQAVDVRRKNIPPVRLFNDLRPYFPTSAATADSLTLQDVVAAAEDDLSSGKGIDYTCLSDLLKAQDWRAADKETYEVMIRAVGKTSGQWFTEDELLHFPCTDLRTIDRLWVTYSYGIFSFSVQEKIYGDCGAKLGEYPVDWIWYKFCDRVGWRKGGKHLSYSDLTANLSLSPIGEFPALVGESPALRFRRRGAGAAGVRGGCGWFSSLAQRLVVCNR